jgi:hypothetical protein
MRQVSSDDHRMPPGWIVTVAVLSPFGGGSRRPHKLTVPLQVCVSEMRAGPRREREADVSNSLSWFPFGLLAPYLADSSSILIRDQAAQTRMEIEETVNMHAYSKNSP